MSDWYDRQHERFLEFLRGLVPGRPVFTPGDHVRNTLTNHRGVLEARAGRDGYWRVARDDGVPVEWHEEIMTTDRIERRPAQPDTTVE